MNPIVGNSIAAGKLVELLGLPKNTTEFTLHMKFYGLATVTATYYPEDKFEGWDTVTRSFNLVPTE